MQLSLVLDPRWNQRLRAYIAYMHAAYDTIVSYQLRLLLILY